METNNILTLARRAKSSNDAENAVKYYEMLLVSDPENWEPVFYVAYFNIFLEENYSSYQKENAVYKFLTSAKTAIELVAKSDFDKTQIANILDEIIRKVRCLSSLEKQLYQDVLDGLGNKIESEFKNKKTLAKLATQLWKECYNRFYSNSSEETKESYKSKILKYDPDFVGDKEAAAQKLEAKKEEHAKKSLAQLIEELNVLDKIPESHFKWYANKGEIKSITIPDNIKIIGGAAFSGCENLEEVIFPENSKIEVVDGSAFKECKSLKKMSFSGENLVIKNWAFSGCEKLKILDLGGVTKSVYIDMKAFEDCKSLKDIIFNPEALVTFGRGALKGTRIKKLVFNPGEFHGDAYSYFTKCIVVPTESKARVDAERKRFLGSIPSCIKVKYVKMEKLKAKFEKSLKKKKA